MGLARHGGHRRALIATCVLVLGCCSSRLFAKETQQPARWTAPAVTLHFAAKGLAPGDRAAAAAQAAAVADGAWRSPCSSAAVRIADLDTARYGAERDGVNLISFLEDRWCRTGRWRNGCYPREELAVTTVYLSPQAGPGGEALIAEVDIEVNAVDYDWFGDSPAKAAPPTDLTALLSHEFGHVFGLEHVASPPSPSGLRATIMTEAAHDGRAAQRRPSPSDKRALCALYPVAAGDRRRSLTTPPGPATWGHGRRARSGGRCSSRPP